MEFNKLILDRFKLIFQKYNLHVTEQYKNYLKLKSDKIVLTISYDDRENSNSCYIGTDEGFLYQIDENILKDIYKSDLKINYVTSETFVSNLAVFFEREGKPLLIGNADALKEVEKYVLKRSNEYTTELVGKQNLDAANKAWEENNYKDFIKYLDKMDRQQLPSSYELKYKIACQKLG